MTLDRVVWSAAAGAQPIWTVAFAGDVLAAEPGLDRDDVWQERASRSSPLVAGADRVCVNLECPLGVDGLAAAAKHGLGSTLAGPASARTYLSGLGVVIAGLANNHAYDYGRAGVERTRALLQGADIAAPGAGRTLADPPEVCVVPGPDGQSRLVVWVAAGRSLDLATRSRAGTEVATRSRGHEAIAAARALGATSSIALLHLGIERTNRPDPDDVRLMDDLARFGFDVVVACHSHRTSGYAVIERDGDQPAVCLYGTGSLLSTVVYGPPEREGLVVHVGIGAGGRPVRVALRPVLLAGDGVGELPDEAAARDILDRVDAVAHEIADGTFAGRFHDDLSQGLAGRQLRDAVVAFRAGGVRGIAAKLRRMRWRHVRASVIAVRRRLRLRSR